MSINKEDLTRNVQQFVSLKDEINLLTNRQKEIKTRLIDLVKEYGEVDAKGHIVLQVDDKVTGVDKITHQRKVSKNLDMDIAEKIIQEKGLTERCVKMVPMLDEAEIMASFYRGELTEADIDAMFPEKVIYAFIV
jgi:hypothetical protein